MTTASILLVPGGLTLPDGSASNLAPAMQRVKSTAAAPAPYFLRAAFDAATDEWACWQGNVPANYTASTGVLKLDYSMDTATSGNVIVEARVAAVTPGDATDIKAKAFAAANTSAGTAVPGTAGFMAEIAITLTNDDGMAAGDFVVVRIARLGSNVSDTATGDLHLVAAHIDFTST